MATPDELYDRVREAKAAAKAPRTDPHKNPTSGMELTLDVALAEVGSAARDAANRGETSATVTLAHVTDFAPRVAEVATAATEATRLLNDQGFDVEVVRGKQSEHYGGDSGKLPQGYHDVDVVQLKVTWRD